MSDEQKKWLDSNYSFLASHIESIGMDQAKSLSVGRVYSQLSNRPGDLLSFVIDNHVYVPNSYNLCTIVNYLGETDNVNADNLNFTRIKNTSNANVTSYVKDNLSKCLQEFSQTIKDEDEESLLVILNNKTINPEDKRNYLEGQKNIFRI